MGSLDWGAVGNNLLYIFSLGQVGSLPQDYQSSDPDYNAAGQSPTQAVEALGSQFAAGLPSAAEFWLGVLALIVVLVLIAYIVREVAG